MQVLNIVTVKDTKALKKKCLSKENFIVYYKKNDYYHKKLVCIEHYAILITNEMYIKLFMLYF